MKTILLLAVAFTSFITNASANELLTEANWNDDLQGAQAALDEGANS